MNMRGFHGRLRVAGRDAATFQSWSLTGSRATWNVEAKTATVDEYWIETGGPFELILLLGEREWRWRGVELLSTGKAGLTVRGAGGPEIR